MSRPTLWNSPPIPKSILENETLLWAIRAKVDDLSQGDDPSANDLQYLGRRYNDSDSAERDAIDAAFVWMTGYTFASICAMVVTPRGKDFERTVGKWRKVAP